MPITELTAPIRRRGGIAILDLNGDIDRDADRPLQRAYDQAAGDGATSSVLLNFAGVGYINSTGIAVIVRLVARARSERRQLSAFGLTEHYRRVFTVTRLSDYIPLYPDEDSAMAGAPPESGVDFPASKGASE